MFWKKNQKKKLKKNFENFLKIFWKKNQKNVYVKQRIFEKKIEKKSKKFPKILKKYFF